VSFLDRPELREWNVSWINSGNIQRKIRLRAVRRSRDQLRPVPARGENFWYGVSRRDASTGQTNPTFSGWYVEGSWVLTGEPRTYSMASAAFLRPVPTSDFDPPTIRGALGEFAARYSDSNLNYDVNSLVSADQRAWRRSEDLVGGVSTSIRTTT